MVFWDNSTPSHLLILSVLALSSRFDGRPRVLKAHG